MTTQELDNQVCRRLGLLFRDPVPALWNDHFLNVFSRTSNHLTDHRAEGDIASQRQDGHLQFAFSKERPVVHRILAERQELGKTRSHRTGLRVELRIVLALFFVKPRRIKGKLVPEPVEVNSLTAGTRRYMS